MRLKDLPKPLRDKIKREYGVVVKPAKTPKQLPYPQFEAACERWGLPKPVREFQFAPPRKWRFDFAFLDDMVALEIDGGAWCSGRHTRGAGFEADCEKLAEAACLGWTVIRCTPKMVSDGRVFDWLRRLPQWHGK